MRYLLVLVAGMLALAVPAHAQERYSIDWFPKAICIPLGPCMNFESVSMLERIDISTGMWQPFPLISGQITGVKHVGWVNVLMGMSLRTPSDRNPACCDGAESEDFLFDGINSVQFSWEFFPAVQYDSPGQVIGMSPMLLLLDLDADNVICAPGGEAPDCIIVPEPPNWILLTTSLLGLALVARRRSEDRAA